MATWKRLTSVDGQKLDVNMDQVCLMQQYKDHTTLHFLWEKGDNVWSVKEAANVIHGIDPLLYSPVMTALFSMKFIAPTRCSTSQGRKVLLMRHNKSNSQFHVEQKSITGTGS